MNVLLWVLQGLGALVYGASGVMKLFMFDQISGDVPSFGALPKRVWNALGVVEITCVILLILPSVLRWHAELSVLAASVLATESLLFIWVHVKYREIPPIVMSGILGLTMAFVAYGRSVLAPLP